MDTAGSSADSVTVTPGVLSSTPAMLRPPSRWIVSRVMTVVAEGAISAASAAGDRRGLSAATLGAGVVCAGSGSTRDGGAAGAGAAATRVGCGAATLTGVLAGAGAGDASGSLTTTTSSSTMSCALAAVRLVPARRSQMRGVRHMPGSCL